MSSVTARHTTQASERTTRRSLAGVGAFTSWFVLLASVAVLLLMVLIPMAAGATPYTVLTDSMRPAMPPGSLAVVRPVDPENLGIGDVVTYQIRSGDPEVITHRIVGQSIDSHGRRTWTTRGDANGADDANPVVAAQIKGKVWYSVPLLGYVNSLFSHGERSIIIVLGAAGLFGYAVYMFVSAAIGAVRHRADRRGRRSPS